MKSKIEWVRRAQRCLRMLSELHRLGYQRLRGMPYMNPLGFRFAIAPKDCFAENGIAIPAVRLAGDDELVAITDADEYFGWKDASGKDARALAEKFVERFPEIATKGKGRDWDYSGWLSELVGFLEGGDMIPICWWENMKGLPEDLLALPIWIDGHDNFEWIGIESVIARGNPVFPLPSSKESRSEHWGKQPYWTDALDEISKAMESGGRLVTIDVEGISQSLYDGDSPAYKLLEAMRSVSDHECLDGYEGAPRLVLALLWKLQEMSERRDR
jgi:hypothetical protein